MTQDDGGYVVSISFEAMIDTDLGDGPLRKMMSERLEEEAAQRRAAWLALPWHARLRYRVHARVRAARAFVGLLLRNMASKLDGVRPYGHDDF